MGPLICWEASRLRQLSVHPLDLGWELELWGLALLCQPGQPDQGLGTGTADTDQGLHHIGTGGDLGPAHVVGPAPGTAIAEDDLGRVPETGIAEDDPDLDLGIARGDPDLETGTARASVTE